MTERALLLALDRYELPVGPVHSARGLMIRRPAIIRRDRAVVFWSSRETVARATREGWVASDGRITAEGRAALKGGP